jgi:hypothetical protein
MRRVPCRRIGPRIALLLLAAAAPQPIGSWLLDCSDPGACVLQHRSWLLPPGGDHPSAALNVERRGDWLVPVVTLREVSTRMAVGGLLALHPRVVLRFNSGLSADLSCGLDGAALVCAPQGPDIAATADALPVATSMQAQVLLSLPGGATLPARAGTLALSGTAEALARLRAAGAAGESLPVVQGLDWIGFLDRVMRAAGFENGAAGFVSRLAGR